MATTIITGQAFSLDVDSQSYNAQVVTCSLSRVADRQEFDVLDGTVYKTLKYTGELQLEMLSDWGAAGSLCEALWNAADTAPDTPLAATLVANTGATFTFDVYPSFPEASGSGSDASQVSVTMTVDQGSITLA